MQPRAVSCSVLLSAIASLLLLAQQAEVTSHGPGAVSAGQERQQLHSTRWKAPFLLASSLLKLLGLAPEPFCFPSWLLGLGSEWFTHPRGNHDVPHSPWQLRAPHKPYSRPWEKREEQEFPRGGGWREDLIKVGMFRKSQCRLERALERISVTP